MSAKVGFVLKEDQRGGRADSTGKQPSRKQFRPLFLSSLSILFLIYNIYNPKSKPKPKPKPKSYVFKYIHTTPPSFLVQTAGPLFVFIYPIQKKIRSGKLIHTQVLTRLLYSAFFSCPVPLSFELFLRYSLIYYRHPKGRVFVLVSLRWKDKFALL